MNWIRQWFTVSAGDFRPHVHHRFELILMRLFFALLVMRSFPPAIPWTQQPEPNGLARLMDLTFLSHSAVYTPLYFATALALLIYVVGYGARFGILFAAMVHVLIFTLKQSQGALGHSSQIISLTLVAQAVVYWLPTIRPLWAKIVGASTLTVHDLSVYASKQVIAGIYLTAGVIKLIRSGGTWIWDSPDIAVLIIKSNHQTFYNKLALDPLLERSFAFAEWVTQHPNLARIALGGGLILELIAFIALWNRRWAFVMGLGLISLHYGIEIILSLNFSSHVWTLWIFYVNVPFWIYFWVQKARGQTLATD